MSKYVSLAAAVTVAVGLSVGVESSQAAIYHFTNITNNSNVNVEGQLSVTVEEGVNDTFASFTFRNSALIDSVVHALYFDDGILPAMFDSPLTDDQISTSGDDVRFSAGAAPPVLPGGEGDPYWFEVSQSSDADNPGPKYGLNEAGDWVTVLFELINGYKFSDVIAALASQHLRVGLHVQSIDGVLKGFGYDDSDSFLNNPTPIPLPPGLVLFLSGLAGIGFLGRYKAKRRELAAA